MTGLVHSGPVGASIPAEGQSGGAASAPLTEWEVAADAICAAMLKRSESPIRSAAERLYAGLLCDVQDYLRENVVFNLSGELSRAKRDADQANDALATVALALGVETRGLPNYPTPKMVADQCWAAVKRLRAQADAATASHKLAGDEAPQGAE